MIAIHDRQLRLNEEKEVGAYDLATHITHSLRSLLHQEEDDVKENQSAVQLSSGRKSSLGNFITWYPSFS